MKTAHLDYDSEPLRIELAEVSIDTLRLYLDNDQKKIAFWVNIYNAYIQYYLRSNPGSFEKKHQFFSKKQIPMFGKKLSFDIIEHGILRKSQWKYGLGNIGKLFKPKFEKKFRVSRREPRIHFVLNCGAKSCPPVRILEADELENQLKQSTTHFIKKSSRYDVKANEVQISKIFMWFRGDFGNKKGIRKLLAQEGIVPSGTKPKIKTDPYDWTLDLDNWSYD